MNANELADALETMTTGWFDDLTLTQSATMLRQQQAEIESLKAGKIRAYDNGYEDGRKPDTNPKLAKVLTADEITLLVDKIVNPDGCDIFTLIRAVEEAHGIRKAQEK
jgi:hypothetical protein